MNDSDLFQKLTRQLAENISREVESRISTAFDQHLRGSIQIVYSEHEAAKFLKCSFDTLANWRRKGLISYCRYPGAKSEKLSTLYSYDIAALLSFRERYLVRVISGDVYRIKSEVTPLGAEMDERKLRRVA